MTRRKIVLIGAGSAMFTQGLVADLILTGQPWSLALVDIDPGALAVAEGLSRRMVAARDADITVAGSLERREMQTCFSRRPIVEIELTKLAHDFAFLGFAHETQRAVMSRHIAAHGAPGIGPIASAIVSSTGVSSVSTEAEQANLLSLGNTSSSNFTSSFGAETLRAAAM